jgi:hypothetical protein
MAQFVAQVKHKITGQIQRRDLIAPNVKMAKEHVAKFDTTVELVSIDPDDEPTGSGNLPTPETAPSGPEPEVEHAAEDGTTSTKAAPEDAQHFPTADFSKVEPTPAPEHVAEPVKE